MFVGVPITELAWLAAAIVVGGAVTGILAGLFGIIVASAWHCRQTQL